MLYRNIKSQKDIDIDSEKGQRANILQLLKASYGEKRVLNICAFKTEGAASSIQTICRGLGIGIEESSYLTSLVPNDKSVNECFKTMKEDKQAATLIKELGKHPNLLEYVLQIEGLTCGVSVHASGVYIMDQDYYMSNAMMRAPSGQPITQYSMYDSDYQGNLKIDLLTIEALDRIRKTMDLLITDGLMQWKGTIKDTYKHYLHPDKIDVNNKKLYKNLCEREIIDAFQYSSPQGAVAIDKIHPNSFQELMDGNALMRLTCEGEQPIDKYVKHKANIDLWYEDMRSFGLTEEEILVLRKHLDKNYGVAATQESVMILAMDENIADFDLVWANKLRKAIAKVKAKDMFKEVKYHFFNNGTQKGNRKEILNYTWETYIVPMLG